MTRMLLAVVALVSAGCYHLTGQVIERNEVKSTLFSVSTETKHLPTKSGVYVLAEVTDDTLHLTAERQTWCQDTTTSVYSRVSDHHRALPEGHWWVLGAGVGMLAAGSTVALVGDSMISDATRVPLGDSSLNKKYDQGRVLLPVGLVVGGLGLLLTGSEVYDMLEARDSREKLRPETKVEKHDQVCARKPAPSAELTLESAGSYHMVKADDHGKVDVPLLEGVLQNFPFGTPFLKVACKECKGATEVVLPVEQAARFVATRGKKEEMEAWLKEHGKHLSAESVRLALRTVQETEKTRAADAICANARRRLEAGESDQAEKLAAQCLTMSPGYAPCVDVQTEARKRIATDTMASARKAMAANRIYDAAISVKRCLQAQPEDPPCTALQQRIQPKLEKVGPDHVKDLAIYEEGGGYMVYFSLVNKLGSYVSAGGNVLIFVTMEKDGFPFFQTPITTFRVTPGDFQARSIGLGLLARPALIVPKLIPLREFTQGFSPLPGFGAAAMRQLAQDADRVLLELEFTDALGKVHTGRETFIP
ncbi:MAG: hypothetical protein ABSF35_14940 [Polyangia bacterium]